MQVAYIKYEIAKRNLVLQIRLKDQAFEQIVAPPGGGGHARPGPVGQCGDPDEQPVQLPGRLDPGELTLLNDMGSITRRPG